MDYRATPLIALLTGAFATSLNAAPKAPDTRDLEVRVWTAEDSELPDLEREVTHLMQVDAHSVPAHHLLSHVMVRMFTRDPSDLYVLRQAADVAQQAVDLAPQNPVGYAALADILDLMGNADRALKLLAEAEARGIKPNWRFAFTRARLLADGGATEKVLSLLEEALKLPDSEPRIIVPYVVAMLQAESTGADLIAKLDDWNRRFPSPLFDLTAALTYTELGDYKKAHGLYANMLKVNPTDTEAKVNDAIVLYRDLKQGQKATVELEDVLAHDQKDLSPNIIAMITAHLGAAYVQQHDWQRARASFVSAIAADHDNLTLVDFMSRTYHQVNAPEKLAAVLTELNDTVDGEGILHAMLGETLSEQLQRHDEAVRAYADAIILDPDRVDFYNGMGLALYRKKSYQAALKVFMAATELDPNDAISRYNEACVLALMGRGDESLNSLAEAVALDPRLAATARLDNDFATVNGTAKFHTLVQEAPAPGEPATGLAH